MTKQEFTPIVEECPECKKLKRLLREAVDWAKCGRYLGEVDDDKAYKKMLWEQSIGQGYKTTVSLIRNVLGK